MRRLNRLLFLEGQTHFIAIAIVLVILLKYSWMVWGFIGLYFIWLWRVSKYVFCVVLICFLGYGARLYWHHVEALDEGIFQGTVLAVDTEKSQLMVRSDETKVLVYQDTVDVRVGDFIQVEGMLRGLEKPSMPYQFDYPRYLESLGIGSVVIADSVTVIEHRFSVYQVRQHVKDYLERFGKSKAYLEAFILGDRSGFDAGVSERVERLGVAHLFAISGLHVTLISASLYKLFGLFKFSNGLRDVALSLFLFVYMIVASFTASIVRAGIFIIILMWLKRTPLKYSAFDVLVLVFLGLLLFNPLYYVQMGFVLTFLVTFCLLLSRKFLSEDGALMASFKVSFIAFLVTLPLIVSFQNAVHPLTVFFNVALVFYTMFLLLPLSYLTFLFPFLESVLSSVILVFEVILELLSQLFPWRIPLAFTPVGWVLIYYLALFYGLSSERLRFKRLKWVFIVLIGVYLTPYLDVRQKVVFFHVHGDSILLKDAHDRCNILIDTGSEDRHHQLRDSLQKMHIRRLDYVFISHWHEDHYGAYDSLAREISIVNLYTREDQALLEEQWIECGAFSIYVFALEGSFSRENDLSLVKVVKFGDETILFTGDIEGPREFSFEHIEFNITMLKVAHHGSITSSNQYFLDLINPHDAVISAHRNNRFDHPHQAVVQRLEENGMQVHRTDLEGTIRFVYYFDTRRKKTIP